MDSVGIELTAQIVESSQWLSESICIVREAIQTKQITKKALERLSCKGDWADLLTKDRNLVLANMPLLPVILSTQQSLDQIYRENDPDHFTRKGGFFIEIADPEDALAFKTIGPALGRLGMMRYPHDPVTYAIWKDISQNNYTTLGAQQIVIEYILRLNPQGKAFYDIARIFLRAPKIGETLKKWDEEGGIYYNSIG